MTRKSSLRGVAAALLLALGAVGCGGDDGGSRPAAHGGGPRIVVSTSILGDVVANLVGDLAEVETVMPRATSPHDFQASAQQVAAMRRADALVVNGGGFEAGLVETIEGVMAEGVPTFIAIDAVEPLGAPEGDRHAHADDADDHAAGAGGGVDPHFFTDPSRVRAAAVALVDFLATELPGMDAGGLRSQAQDYLDELAALDAEVEEVVSVVPAADRKLVTNHEVFGYFAERYGFEVVGAVIPSTSTQAEASAAELAELAELVRAEDVEAIFADTSSPSRLADALSAEVGDVAVVELFSESLGPEGSEAATYLDLMRTDARRIADALSP